MKFVSWWKRLEKSTLVIGIALGSIVTGLGTTLYYWPWLKDYQGIAAAVITVGLGAWTVSVAAFHRERDAFQTDKKKIEALWSEVTNTTTDAVIALEKIESISNFPRNARTFIYWMVLANQQNTGLIQDMPYKVNDCVSAINDWFLQCREEGIFVKFRSDLDPKPLYEQMVTRREIFDN